MLQTGVIGAETYEGASSHQAFGRSASQIHETSQSSSRTGSFSTGVTVLGVGLSSNISSTGVSGQRTVDQVSDTTTRDASQERRELQSHMTRVENVLTVLNTKYLGTPFLRFSLSPRPLEQLSVDSSDPSLWYGQLLQRRSSGIEGIQEYTALLIVPKGEDFCLTARLRRVCVLDDRPSEPDLNERFDFGDPVHIARIYDYILRTYPIGTPVDDLDVEIRRGSTGALATSSRPVLEDWAIGGAGQLIARVVATSPTAPSVLHGSAPYKMLIELWLETLRDEFERDCATSPLETGTPLGETLTLDTCLNFATATTLNVTNTATSVAALRPVRLDPHELGVVGPPSVAPRATQSVKARALETVVRWNTMSAGLKRLLDNPASWHRKGPASFADANVVNLLLRRWAKLGRDDPRNVSLAQIGRTLELNVKQLKILNSAGIYDVRGLAQHLLARPTIDRMVATPLTTAEATTISKTKKQQPAKPRVRASLTSPIDNRFADEILKNISGKLLAPLDHAADG
jgi:hypothetical protein